MNRAILAAFIVVLGVRAAPRPAAACTCAPLDGSRILLQERLQRVGEATTDASCNAVLCSIAPGAYSVGLLGWRRWRS